MAKTGYCTGPVGSKPKHKQCPGKIQKFIHIVPRRNMKATIQMLDEWHECECRCHKKGKKK